MAQHRRDPATGSPERPLTGGMNAMNRRRFLIASGVAGGAALAAGAGVVSWKDFHHAAKTRPRVVGSGGVLVVVTLYGGNDGLNMIVPIADPTYTSQRPGLALTPEETLPLAEGLAVNSAMPGLKSQWEAGTLAIVRGVSYPTPSLSHFQSMDIWQSASPSEPSSTGWLGRWLDATGTDPVRAVAVDTVLPPMLAGAKCSGATVPNGQLILPPVGFADELWAMDSRNGGVVTPADAVRQSGLDLRTVAGIIDPALSKDTAADKSNSVNGATGANSLQKQLAIVAQLISAGVPSRVYSVSLTGFDTHSTEKGTSTALLGQLDTALTSFHDALAQTPHGSDVTTMVYSEFGRRVQANASQGTDHGTAAPVLVLGNPVAGGFIGEQPSLTTLDMGNLIPTTDFRSVYATMLEDVLAADVEEILGSQANALPRLPLLRV